MGEEKAVRPKRETAWKGVEGVEGVEGGRSCLYSRCDACCQWQLSCDARAASI